MPGNLQLKLTAKEEAELINLRDHASKPYLRERAAAILKIGSGLSGREVALNRLNKRRCQDTVYEWVKRYREEGTNGLKVRPGSGRKTLFFFSKRYSKGSE